MRRAYQSNDIYFTDDGTAIAAIALGFDFCAEHEWGVKRLREHLGMLPTKEYSRDNAGEQRNRIGVSKINKNMIHRGTLENGDAYVLFFYNRDNREITEEHVNRLIGNIYDGQKLATAWDERSFGIRVPSETGPLLNEFFDKIFEGKGYLFLGGSNNPFSNPSLTLAVEDAVDDHIKKMWYDIDIDYYDLKDASKKIGIKSKIDEANRKWVKENPSRSHRGPYAYFALSPAWAKNRKSVETEYDVIYWLNPMDQQNHFFGWVTVEDLQDWLKGKGRIPGNGFKQQKEANKDA